MPHAAHEKISFQRVFDGVLHPIRYKRTPARADDFHIVAVNESIEKSVIMGSAKFAAGTGGLLTIRNFGKDLTLSPPDNVLWNMTRAVIQRRPAIIIPQNHQCRVKVFAAKNTGNEFWSHETIKPIDPHVEHAELTHIDLLPRVIWHSDSYDWTSGHICILTQWIGSNTVGLYRADRAEPLLSWDLETGYHVLPYRFRGESLNDLRNDATTTHVAMLELRVNHHVHWEHPLQIDIPVAPTPPED